MTDAPARPQIWPTRVIELRPVHCMRIVADQEFKDPAFALGQALKHMFAQS
jgi:hypothetical protein